MIGDHGYAYMNRSKSEPMDDRLRARFGLPPRHCSICGYYDTAACGGRADASPGSINATTCPTFVDRPEWPVPDDLDPEVKRLCIALHSLPGVETLESCCGHGVTRFSIWLRIDWESRGLLLLSRLLTPNYYVWDGGPWALEIAHFDVDPRIGLWLRGGVGEDAYRGAAALAEEIERHANNQTDHYNILHDYHPAANAAEHLAQAWAEEVP